VKDYFAVGDDVKRFVDLIGTGQWYNDWVRADGGVGGHH